MADKRRQLYKPRRNNFPSDSSKSNFPRASEPVFNGYSKKSTTSTSGTDDFSRRGDKDCNDDGDEDLRNLIGTCPFMCPGIPVIPLLHFLSVGNSSYVHF